MPKRKSDDRILGQIYEADQNGPKEDALDLIFEWFDDQFVAKNYRACDMVLARVSVNKLSTTALLGILSVTLLEKDCLRSRAGLYRRTKKKLMAERPGDAALTESLLRGLE